MSRKLSGKFLINTTKDKDLNNGFTLVLCFSRRWCIENFFKAFDNLHINHSLCHLIVFDNTDIVTLSEELLQRTESLVDKFASVRYYKSYRKSGDAVIGDDDHGFYHSKLPHILAMQLDLCGMITTETFACIEDDTIVPPNALERLYSLLDLNKKIAVVSALETGRSPYRTQKVRVGVHYIKRRGDLILERISPSPYLRGVREVDACGWYCFVAYTDIWKQALKLMPRNRSKIPRFALDGLHTNNIKRLGYKILADFDLWCLHMNLCGGQIIFWERDQARKTLDVWLPRWKKHAQGVILTK